MSRISANRRRRGHILRACAALAAILLAGLPSACTRLLAPVPQRDLAAERLLARLKQTNAGLTRFKAVAKLTLASPGKPVQAFRAAVAGKLPDHLRIDLLAPYGGSAGSVAADGEHLFLVMHATHEYYKKRFGDGSLRRIVHMDLTVGDLLTLLVGRIPVATDLSARLVPAENDAGTRMVLYDRWDRPRQRISFDAAGYPVRSIWFDSHQNLTLTLTVDGRQVIDGFVLPKRIDLSADSGQRVTVVLDRYTANAGFDERLFTLPPLSS